MFAVIFPVVVPVFAIAGIGFWWARSGRPFDTNAVAALVGTVGMPVLMVHALLKVRLSEGALADMILAGVLNHAIFIIVGWLVLTATRRPIRAFLPSIVFGNTGNMGFPLCLFAFGEEGLALAVGYFIVHAVLLFSVGNQFAAGQASPRGVLRSPTVWAIAAALTLLLTDTHLPEVVTNTMALLAGLTIPLMLLALGVSLAQLKVSALGTATFLAGLRLGIGFATGLGVATLLGLEGTAFGVVVVEASMPVAVMTYLFAARHGNRPEEVAGSVMVSTLLSFFTLPLILGHVMG